MSESGKVAAAEAAAAEIHVVTTAMPPEDAVWVVLRTWRGRVGATAIGRPARRAIASGDTDYVCETKVPGDPSRAHLRLAVEPPDPQAPGMTRLSMAVVDYTLDDGFGMPLYGGLVIAVSNIRKAEKRLKPVRVEIQRG